jgi:cobalt-zinc-cadmium efflux system outer membrane protein
MTLVVLGTTLAHAAEETRRVSLDQALRAAHGASPDLVVARVRESVAKAEVDVAGVYPNPSVAVGTSTQTAKFSGTLSLPLLFLGQRGAAVDAARADQVRVAFDTQVTWNDVRRGTEGAYVALWLADKVAATRRDSAQIQATLEGSVVQRVQVGSAPEVDSLRVHAERVRADADVLEADAAVTAAGSELGRWMGVPDGGALRASADPPVPDAIPSLDALLLRLESSAAVRRELSDAHAAELRADRERALVRPAMSLDLGTDVGDPTLPTTNYRAQLNVEVPLFNQRGGYIDRERAAGDVARARAQAARVQGAAELSAAYRTFEAATLRQRTLVDAVLPAAQGAAKATEEAYVLGRAQLVAVLDAERALVDARETALVAQAARATAWSDIEHALGAP